jgi:O-antigen ligase
VTAIRAKNQRTPRQRRNTQALAGQTNSAEIRAWLGRGIELAWLVAAVVTPLIVLSETEFIAKTELPKIAVIRLSAGLILLLLLAELGLSIWQRHFVISSRQMAQLAAHLKPNRRDPRHWVMASMAAVLITTALAFAFALLPGLSMWGADPSGDSNSLYSTASYGVLFFGVATRLRTPAQLWRLLGAMVIAGTLAALIGIAQYFGEAPFGIRSTSGSVRISGTAGNPIFFATLLTVTLMLTIGMSLSIRELTRKTIGWLSIYGLLASLQMMAILVTLSRGPWIGAIAGVLAVAALAPPVFGWRRVATTGAVTAAAFVVALVFLLTTSYTAPDNFEATGSDTSRTSVSDIRARATSLSGVFDSNINGRLPRWEGALDLALNRPEPPAGAALGYPIRFLFGYGPDTFPDVFTMVAPENLSNIRTTAAHNDPLNRLVETGLIGLLAWAALWSSLAFFVLRNLWTSRHNANRRNRGTSQVVTLAIGAALLAWFVSRLTGIPKSGDIVLVWMLAGLVLAAPRVLIPRAFPSNDLEEPTGEPETVPDASATSPAIRYIATATIGLLALATIWITWTETVQRLSADSTAANAVSTDLANPNVSSRLNDIDQAIAQTADQPRYHTIRSEIYELIANDSGSSDLTTASAAAILEATESAERALALNPLDRDFNFRAAYLNWELAKTGDLDAALRTYALYERLVVLTPQSPDVGPRLAAVGEALGIKP